MAITPSDTIQRIESAQTPSVDSCNENLALSK